jgi:diacylglycerol kinase family enzyme
MRNRGIDPGARVTWESGDIARYVDEAIAEGVDTALHLNLDGEPVKAKRFHIECDSARLPVHLPGDCPLPTF